MRVVQRRLQRARSFSALQRAENSSIQHRRRALQRVRQVSVLFSEPKIPQSSQKRRCGWRQRGFSALQRAENSSIVPASRAVERDKEFQCSSASRKFLNRTRQTKNCCVCVTFQCSSASRKFLNGAFLRTNNASSRFQCSSASRKFLNRGAAPRGAARGTGFSALQRAENSSINSAL